MVRHTSLSSPLERTCRSSMVRSLGTVVVAWLHVCSALTLARVGLSVIYTDLLSIIIICILIRNIATSSFWLLCYCYAVVCVFSPTTGRVAFSCGKVGVESLTCVSISMHAVHTKARQTLAIIHKCLLGRTGEGKKTVLQWAASRIRNLSHCISSPARQVSHPATNSRQPTHRLCSRTREWQGLTADGMQSLGAV